jgi:glycosyltransferase involved in cell wall biosynthesis
MKDKEHIETLNISDLILVGTHLHKRKLKQHYTSTPVEVISCMLDFAKYKYVPIKEKNNDQVIISWQQSCADAYVDDILLIAQVLNNLVKSYGVKIHLYGWHMGKDYKDNRSVVKEVLPSAKFIKYEPMERYIKNIVPQISKSDIFIMPYINSPYRWGKSGFGLKRMMLLGIPVVVSSTQHHNTMIKNGVNGFTASNNKEWYYYLEKLIKDKSLREIFSINGRKSMEKEFNNEKVIKQFIKMVNKHLDVF